MNHDRATTLPRALPMPPVGRLRASRIVERNLLVYRRTWLILVSGLFEPVFYLFAVGVGLGQLVGDVAGPGGQTISYTAFVAPALLAASAMNGAVLETTFNIFFRLRFGKVYDAVLATPMRPVDIAVGEVSFALLRGALYAVAFLVVAGLAGLVTSFVGALLALPAVVLIGFAFGAVGLAATTFMRSWQDFDLIQLVILPLFLFSATFYPLDVYPPAVQQVARVSPLYHGVEILRACLLGYADVTLVGHVAVLLALGIAGMLVARRRLYALLTP